jgi:hypothetical protein
MKRGEAQAVLEKDGTLQSKNPAGLRDVFLHCYNGKLDLVTLL